MRKSLKNWSNCMVVVLLLCSLTACGYKQFEDNIRMRLQEGGQVADQETEINAVDSERNEITWSENPDHKSTVQYTLKNAYFYKNIENAGLSKEDIIQIPMECLENWQNDPVWSNVKSECGFIMLDLEVYNIDYAGNPYDGSINVGGMGFFNKGLEGSPLYGGIPMGYFDAHPEGEKKTETNYWHLFLKPGEKTNIKIGTLVSASNIESARKYTFETVGREEFDLSQILQEGD